MLYKLLIIIISCCILNACHDTRCSPSIFTGISATDVNGQALSSEDPDDWRFDDDWSNGIRNYFNTDLKRDCQPGYNYKIIAYPNPCDDVLGLYLDKDSATTVDLRLLNSVCGVVVSLDEVTNNNIYLQINNNSPEKVLRLYYKFIKNGCEYQGHGDIYTQ